MRARARLVIFVKGKYDSGTLCCDVDAERPDLAGRHPKFRGARALTAVLRPGDALYIPKFWFHQVTSLSVSVSANVFCSTPSEWVRAGLPRACLAALHSFGLYRNGNCVCHAAPPPPPPPPSEAARRAASATGGAQRGSTLGARAVRLLLIYPIQARAAPSSNARARASHREQTYLQTARGRPSSPGAARPPVFPHSRPRAVVPRRAAAPRAHANDAPSFGPGEPW